VGYSVFFPRPMSWNRCCRCWMLDSGYWMLDTRCWMLDA
jgi:hypothetical protein